MANPWHDIDDLGSAPWKRGRDESPVEESKGSGDDEVVSDSSSEPQIRLLAARFEPHPVYGYEPNRECRISGEAAFLQQCSCTRCTVELFAVVNGVEEPLAINPHKYGSTNIDVGQGTFSFSVPLYLHRASPDRESFVSAVRYRAHISAARAEHPLDVFLDLPDHSVATAPDLCRGMYDDKGVESDAAAYPVGGEGYVAGTPVHAFQQILERLRYLPMGSADGVFAQQTERAVKWFQRDALGTLRLPDGEGKLVDVGQVSWSGDVDGVVRKGVRDETALWRRDNYLRPLVELYRNDYDHEATLCVGKPARGDEYHGVGEPVVHLQKLIGAAKAYGGRHDGLIGDTTLAAVKLFQECAAQGSFATGSGAPGEREEKLRDYRAGVVGVSTWEAAEAVKKEGLVVRLTAKHRFPLEKQYQDKGYHSGMRSFGSPRSNGARYHAGCDLYAPLGEKVFAVADGTITAYHNYYWKTFALVVDHGDFIALYGEVQPPADPEKHGITDKDVKDYIEKLEVEEKQGLSGTLQKGSSVKKGEHIAYVGQLYENNGTVPFKNTMVHFEKYKKTATGPLTQREYTGTYEHLEADKKHLTFLRRKDLENPTLFLDECTFE